MGSRSRRLDPYAAVRVGEASNPGPFSFVTCNVASFSLHQRAITDLGADVLCLQETRHTEKGRDSINEHLEETGYTAQYGTDQPPVTPGSLAGEAGGVAIIGNANVVFNKPRFTDEEAALTRTGRWTMTSVVVPKAGLAINVHNVYGVSGAMTYQEAMIKNEKLLKQVLSAAEATKAPCIIAGDFNVDPKRSMILKEVLHHGWWVDVAAAFAGKNDPMDTFFGHRGSRSRIDVVLANHAALQFIKGVTLLSDSRFSDHVPIQVDFDFPSYDVKQLMFHKPPRIPLEDAGSKQQQDFLMRLVAVEFENDFLNAITDDDVERAWQVWSDAAEDYLLRLASEQVGDDRVALEHNRRGRGENAHPAWQALLTRKARKQDLSEPETLRVKRKAARITEEIMHKRFIGRSHETYGLAIKITNMLRDIELPDVAQQALNTRNWKELRKTLLEDVTKDEKMYRKLNIRQWRNKLTKSFENGGSAAFKKFGGVSKAPVSVVTLPDGSMTAKVHEVDAELRRCWEPVMAKHNHGAEHVIPDDILGKYGGLLQHILMDMKPITTNDVLTALDETSNNSAPGSDGWQAKDVKLLHGDLVKWLSWLFAAIESNGRWPTALMHALITLIDKGKGTRPLDLRPISVTSIVYRLWARCWANRISKWQESVLDWGQYGGRKGRSAVQALMAICLPLEHAELQGQRRVVIAIDLAKAFDNVPFMVALTLAEKMGVPSEFLCPLQAVYENMERHFRIGAGVGKGFGCTNGILQGCPASGVLMNLIMLLGTRIVQAACPDARIVSYVDDITIIVDSVIKANNVLAAFQSFLEETGQEMNLTKTKVSYSWPSTELVKLGNTTFEHVNYLRILGVDVGYVAEANGDHRFRIRIPPDRVDDAINACRRLATTDISFDNRAMLLAGAVGPKTLYGTEVADIEPAKENALRASIVAGQWMKPGRRKSTGLIMTLLTKGHLLDPMQAILVRRLVAINNAFLQVPEYQRMILDIIASEGGKKRGDGPVANLLAGQKRYYMSLLPFLGTPSAESGHKARELARNAAWRQVEEQRKKHGDAVGVGGGIDREQTWQLLRDGNLSETRRGALRYIISGAFYQDEHAPCPRCGGHNSVEHAFWECPFFADIRRRFGLHGVNAFELPVMLRILGIVPAGFVGHVHVGDLQSMQIEIFRAVLADSGVDLHD